MVHTQFIPETEFHVGSAYYKSSEQNFQSALNEIEQLNVVCEKPNLIRVEK